MNDNHITKDEGLQGNEKIEEAIAALQKELTDEMLAQSDRHHIHRQSG